MKFDKWHNEEFPEKYPFISDLLLLILGLALGYVFGKYGFDLWLFKIFIVLFLWAILYGTISSLAMIRESFAMKIKIKIIPKL